jgi:DNA-binding Lrp family transcriptional regulator
MSSLDALDAKIVLLFAQEPKIGVLGASRRLRVARGTVQARLDRLEAQGVVTGWAPSLDPVALGFPVSAFATLEITQAGGHQPVASPPCWSEKTIMWGCRPTRPARPIQIPMIVYSLSVQADQRAA